MNNHANASAILKGCGMELGCPAHLLVVDRTNGPADLLSAVLGRLFAPQVTIMRANSEDDVSYILASRDFNLIVVGLEEVQGGQFSILRNLRHVYVSTPIMVVGHQLGPADLESCRQLAVHEAIEMPRRAAQLKFVIISITRQYLQCM